MLVGYVGYNMGKDIKDTKAYDLVGRVSSRVY